MYTNSSQTATRRRNSSKRKFNQTLFNSSEVMPQIASRSFMGFARDAKNTLFTSPTIMTCLVDEAGINMTFAGEGYVLSLIYQEVKP